MKGICRRKYSWKDTHGMMPPYPVQLVYVVYIIKY